MHRALLVLIALICLAWFSPTAHAGPPPGVISPALAAATANGAFAPFVIVLKEQADLSGAARLATKREKGRYVLDRLRTTAERTQAGLQAELRRLGVQFHSYYIVNSIAVDAGTRDVVDRLAARGEVARIESDARIRLGLPTPGSSSDALLTDATAQIEWGVKKVRAPVVWALGYRGKYVVVASADTGVQWNHPALKLHYRGYSNGIVNHNYNWWDAVHQDVNGNGTNPCGFSSRRPCDDFGHGTHTIGTAVGGDSLNRIGVAPGARWIACRNMEEGYGRPSQYLECFQFFLAPWNLNGKYPNPDRNADIINNSWICPPDEGCLPDSLQSAVEAARAAGIFVVASAGNSGSACSTIAQPPAIYQAAFTVGASDSTDALWGLSSRGPVTVDESGRLKPDLIAPGVMVRSSFPGNRYVKMSGTSMAAPHVAGAVALLWSARPRLKGQIDLTVQALTGTAVTGVSAVGSCGGTDGSVIPNNLFGYGRLDIYAAVNSVPK